ncbi:hypothetical protein [Streptomyces sp.]|uniref:hypothetical protein n=1 Tax=Streptomyces sp. TaxID=1931 RepID=UPI002D750F86|nr:hypothetical protein [Streptomyces sp.]HZF92085.1 hypothetical protein [Streptomyces sp.]
MPDLPPGSIIKAADTPPTVADTQSSTVTTTSTAYTTSGADCSVVWVAPTTGRVKIHAAARMVNSSATSGSLLAPETRLGGTVGAGTVVETPVDAIGASHYGNTFARSGVVHLLTGLTPGETYNTRLLMRSSVGTDTASFASRELIVEPAT